MKAGKRNQLNLLVTDSTVTLIEELKEMTASPTRVEVVRKALSLLHAFKSQEQQGYDLVFRNKEGREKLLVLWQ